MYKKTVSCHVLIRGLDKQNYFRRLPSSNFSPPEYIFSHSLLFLSSFFIFFHVFSYTLLSYASKAFHISLIWWLSLEIKWQPLPSICKIASIEWELLVLEKTILFRTLWTSVTEWQRMVPNNKKHIIWRFSTAAKAKIHAV